MRKLTLTIFLFAVTASFLVPAMAKLGIVEKYKVQKGDTLWALSGERLDDPFKWGIIVGANPFLQSPGRVIERGPGRVVVIIKPGETLTIPGDINKYAIPVPPEALAPKTEPTVPAAVETTQEKASFPWLYFLLGLIGISLLGVAYAFWRRVNRDPATSGEPVVRNGIRPAEPQAVNERFNQIALRRYAEINPAADLRTDHPVRIGDIEEGFLNGHGRVQYRDRTEMRRLSNEPAFRARFRFPNGTEEDLYFLQRCANDVTYSGVRFLGFTFTRRAIVTVPPPPEEMPLPVPTPIRPVPAPAAVGPQTTVLVVGGRQYTVPVDSTIRVGEDGTIVLSVASACNVTIRPVARKRVTRPKVVPTAAAGAEPAS